jgi:hypothetical protein
MRANTIPPFATFKIFATCRRRPRPLTYRTVDETKCGWHGTVMTEVVIETDQLSLRQARERVCSSVKPRPTWRTQRQNATGGLRPMPKVMVVDDAHSELTVVETIPTLQGTT